jgi:4-phosphopantoate--beta-alanine ligase
MQRHRIEQGVKDGYVTLTGMIAQGRGEAFDYLIEEKTTEPALRAEQAAVELLLQDSHMRGLPGGQPDPQAEPAVRVLSVNGNVAALCAEDIVKLADSLKAKIEVNLFYWTKEREEKIAEILKKAGAKEVYGTGEKVQVPGLDSARGRVDPEGIAKADVVLVMLEDGDRTEALKNWGKKVIAIDLNPFSRTAQMADITIVDNVVRAIPNMIKFVEEGCSVKDFDNKKNLQESISEIKKSLS